MKNKANFQIILLYLIVLTVIGGCMPSPKIEYNIEDQYTVTQNNAVGAEDRGNVAVTGVSELIITTIPVNLGGTDYDTLKGIMDYAQGNGNDVVTIQLDYDFIETDLTIYTGMALQADDGYTVTASISGQVDMQGTGVIIGLDFESSYDTVTPFYLLEWGSSGTGNGQFNSLQYLARDSNDNIYASDQNNYRIQKFTSTGTYVTQWGSSGTGNGQFNFPRGVAVDSNDYVYVVDRNNHRIQKFTSTGTYVTKWGTNGSGDGQFNFPEDIAVDSNDYVYVTDSTNLRVQKFTSTGTYVTKWSITGSQGISTDSNNNVYVVVSVIGSASDVQKFDSSGNFITKWGTNGSGDGQFRDPRGVAVDSNDYVYVTDRLKDDVQKFDSSGNFITKWGTNGSGDGQFNFPLGAAVDSSDNVYIADNTDERIQKFTYFDLGTDALIKGNVNTEVKYCTIQGNYLHGSEYITGIQNTILKSKYNNSMYYQSPADNPTFTKDCQNNLLIAGAWGVKFLQGVSGINADNPTFNFTFKNNTIKAANGISIFNTTSSFVCKNNIVDASAVAIDLNQSVTSFTISNSIVNGQVSSFTGDTITLTNCEEDTNPLFKSMQNEDYTLQSKAEGYPKDSVAIGLGDDSKDAGCYDVTRTNTGESADSLTLQYIDTNDTTPPYQLPYRYEYPFKESSVTYQGNYIKNMDVRVGIITLDSQIGMDLEIQRELEYIQSLNVPIRFYPNGDTGIAFIIDKTGTIPDYSRDKSATLTLDFTAMTATVPSNFEFEINYLKGFWLEVDDGVGGDTYYYIDSNTKTVLNLVNREDETTPGDGSYTCKILWCYARMQDVIEYPSALSDDAAEQQIISTSKIELFMLDRKDI